MNESAGARPERDLSGGGFHVEAGGAEITVIPVDGAVLRVRVAPAARAGDTAFADTSGRPGEGRAGARGFRFGQFTVEFDVASLALRIVGDDARVHFDSPSGWIEHQGHRILLRANLAPGERIHGLGQSSMAKLDLRDTERRMWHEVRSARFACSTGIPSMLSSRGYGLLLDSGHPSRFVIGNARLAPPPSLPKQALLAPAPWPIDEPSGEERADRITVIVDHDVLEFDLVLGADLREVLQRQSARAGAAEMLPRWALGYIQSRNRYRNQEDLLGIAREFRRRRIPCDVVVIDWYWFPEFGDFDWNRENWPDVPAMVAELEAMGFKPMISLHPYVDRASRNWEHFQRLGILLVFPPEARRITSHDAILDLTNPLAREVLGAHAAALFGQGFRAWWIDQVQPEVHPVGSLHHGGSREAVHNRYPLLFCQALHDAQRGVSDQRVFTLTFAAYTGAPKFGAVLWTGDVDPDWAILREQIVIGQQLSLSGMPYWTTDMGGYVHYAHYDPEIYVRWFQWGVFCPLFRAHAKRPEAEPWAYGEAIEHAVGEAIRLRYRLIPYLYQLMWETVTRGLPMVRPMCLESSEADALAAGDLQFFLGDRILVAPVCEPAKRTRSVRLPGGRWFDGWTGECLDGGRSVETFAPLDRVPFFIRAGAILPWCSEPGPSVGKPDGAVELALYPGAVSSSTVVLDDGETYAYRRGAVGRLEIEYDGVAHSVGLRWVAPASRPEGEALTVEFIVHGRFTSGASPLAVDGESISDRLERLPETNPDASRFRLTIPVPDRHWRFDLSRVGA